MGNSEELSDTVTVRRKRENSKVLMLVKLDCDILAIYWPKNEMSDILFFIFYRII